MTGYLQIEPIGYNLMGFEAQTGLQSINITKISAISACVFLAILALFIVFSKVRVLKQASERVAKTFERAEQSVYDFLKKLLSHSKDTPPRKSMATLQILLKRLVII